MDKQSTIRNDDVKEGVFTKCLERYSGQDFIIRAKASFMCKVNLAIVFFLIFLFCTTIILQTFFFGGLTNSTIAIEAVTLAAIVFNLYLIKSGKLNASIHSLLHICFFAIWMVMFLGKGAAIQRLDTIVLSFGLLGFTPLVLKKNNQSILYYTLLNLLLLALFCYYLSTMELISEGEIWDYLIDNAVAYILCATIAYNFFSIYKRSNEKTQKALLETQKAEEALVKLNEELERLVEKRTIELKNALDALEESNMELRDLNENLANESGKLLLLNDKLALSEQELKTAVNTKDKFFSIISHDLRNPVGGVRNLLDLIVEKYEVLGKEEITQMLGILRTAAGSTCELLENLLLWSRLQTKNIEYVPSEIFIKSAVQKVVKLLESQSSTKEVTIIDNTLPGISFEYDHFFIDTILRNLLSNSIKYSQKDGRIWIESSASDSEIVLKIIDEGVGMEKNDAENLFTPGPKTSKPGTNSEKGSGIGLSICKEFVDLRGGKISAQSESGKGCVITITFPVRN